MTNPFRLVDNAVTAVDAFEQFWAAYPRKERWRSARDLFEALTDPDSLRAEQRTRNPQAAVQLGQGSPTAAEIIAGAKAYTAHVQREGIEYRHVQLPTTWLTEQGWRSVYELPKPAEQPAFDRIAKLKEGASRGNKFCQDMLKREGL